MIRCRVQLLDGKDFEEQIDKKVTGQVIFDKVCKHLNLLEKDYFGCTYREKGTKFWLRNNKTIVKQVKANPVVLTFEVKFYPPDPGTLREELTRYQLFLQVRTEILFGRLPCSFVTQALLGSYAVQSQLGDYDESEYGTGTITGYLKGMQFSPSPSDELHEKIVELHKTHSGESPAQTEMNYLDNARNLAMYGVHLHQAKDSEGTDVNIGVCAFGLLVYKDKLRIHRFIWPKIIKISYKGEKFIIKLRKAENEAKDTTLIYKLETVPLARRLWRIAMEHHTFFRMREPENPGRGKFLRSNPKYNYVGRTYYQSQMDAGQFQRSGQDFTRCPFTSTKSLNAIPTTGYSTERAEQHIEESSRTATLNMKKIHSRSSMPNGQYDEDPNFNDFENNGQIFLGSGYDPVRYGGPIEPAYSEIDDDVIGFGHGYNNAAPPLPTRTAPGYYLSSNPYGQQDGSQDGGHNDYRNGKQGSNWSGTTRTNSPGSVDVHSPGYTWKPGYDNYGNILIPNNNYINRQVNGSETGSQDDHLPEQRYGADMAGERGAWDQSSTGSMPKTTTRTYTTPDGTVVTEYRTLRNGVIETRIEKRTRRVIDEDEEIEEIDYDRALTDAIHAVTDMNPDLAVQKIEIHTKSEEV